MILGWVDGEGVGRGGVLVAVVVLVEADEGVVG